MKVKETADYYFKNKQFKSTAMRAIKSGCFFVHYVSVVLCIISEAPSNREYECFKEAFTHIAISLDEFKPVSKFIMCSPSKHL